MTSFDEREQAFERRFVAKQDAEFKLKSHRNRDVAAWVATTAGLTDALAQKLTYAFIEAELTSHDEASFIETTYTLLQDYSVDIDRDTFCNKLIKCETVLRKKLGIV